MQLSDLSQVETVSARCGFAIFELPETVDFTALFPHALHIARLKDAKNIRIAQLREIFPLIHGKQSSALFVVVENAETLTDGAGNCVLKALEETVAHVHFVFLVNNLSAVMPTLRSRAFCYRLPDQNHIDDAPAITAKDLALAKTYLSLRPHELLTFTKTLTKDAKTARNKATALVKNCITLLYKSYFKTGNPQFLLKLERLLAVSDALSANGNIKLQLIAPLL